MPFTTLERQIFKIDGSAIGPGGTIAAGTILSTVRLTTIDQDTGPLGPLQINTDALTLNRGEAVSLRINGVEVFGAVPNFFFTQVQTDAGSLRGLVFTVGQDSYIIPQANFDVGAAAQVTAPAQVGTSAVTSVQTVQYGLNPENADTYRGNFYSEAFYGSTRESSGVAEYLIYDADGIRGNADSSGEETAVANLFNINLFGGAEGVATLRFGDGSLLALDSVRYDSFGSYGYVRSSYLFDDAALTAANKTLADIAGVLAFGATDHALNWTDLGFDLVAQGSGNQTPDPVTPPPVNNIFGTTGANVLVGTAGRDALFGRAGNDTLTGGGGNDAFVFGAETRNGRRETDTVLDYQVGRDIIAFEDAAQVTSVNNISGGVRIIFAGDRDRVDVFGDGLNAGNVTILADDFIFLL